jgi:hypothetical protein
MYLCSEHGILSGNDGHILLKKFQEFILDSLRSYKESLDESVVVKYITGKVREIADEHRQPSELVAVEPVLILALQLSEELLMIKEASDRWGIIINLWMEMLCYMSFHCGPDFHIKHLSTGGEFITHVKVLIYNLGYVSLRFRIQRMFLEIKKNRTILDKFLLIWSTRSLQYVCLCAISVRVTYTWTYLLSQY